MNTALFVISDLHLGGARANASDVRLVVNRDIVDFLAEEAFSSFTLEDNLARDKLARIMDKHTGRLGCAARIHRVGRLSDTPAGKYDVELSSLRAGNCCSKGSAAATSEFIYDIQAHAVGPVLSEHGNRYDRWNVVSHDALRAIRSAHSRREARMRYLGPRGSQLVQQVMNPIKKEYLFGDFLVEK